jgi:uncharacterized XkdX family phage protein
MSRKFEKVKTYYEKGLWSKARVREAVIRGWITEDEYEEITGEVYIN